MIVPFPDADYIKRIKSIDCDEEPVIMETGDEDVPVVFLSCDFYGNWVWTGLNAAHLKQFAKIARRLKL